MYNVTYGGLFTYPSGVIRSFVQVELVKILNWKVDETKYRRLLT